MSGCRRPSFAAAPDDGGHDQAVAGTLGSGAPPSEGAMMARLLARLVCLLLLSTAGALADVPPAWRKTMTDDPSTNSILTKFSEPLPQPDEQLARTIHLAVDLAVFCEGVSLDEMLLRKEIERFEALSDENKQRAIVLTNPSFSYLDTDAIAHLCAGVNHLFGSSGVLVRGLMSPGVGEANLATHVRKFHIKIPGEFLGR